MKTNDALRAALRGLLIEIRNEQSARVSARAAEARLDIVWDEANTILTNADKEAQAGGDA